MGSCPEGTNPFIPFLFISFSTNQGSNIKLPGSGFFSPQTVYFLFLFASLVLFHCTSVLELSLINVQQS